MQLGRRVRVRAGSGCLTGDPNLALFTATLAQNAALNGRVLLPESLAAGRSGQFIIRDIEVVSVDGNIWEWWFFSNSGFALGSGATNPAEAWRGSYLMAAGTQIGGAGLFHARANPSTGAAIDLLYEDDDAATTDASGLALSNKQQGAYLNATLINRSAGAKTALGYFDVTFVCEPTLGY